MAVVMGEIGACDAHGLGLHTDVANEDDHVAIDGAACDAFG